MNNWWWVQYLCGMAVMCSRKNMHLDHLFFTEIPAVFKTNVFIKKPRYFNTFLCVFLWLPSSAIHSSHWMMMKPSFLQNILQKKRLWPSLSASPWPQSCRQTQVVPNAYDSPSHWHSCQWSIQFSIQLDKNTQLRQCWSWGFTIMIPEAHYYSR